MQSAECVLFAFAAK